MAFDWTQLPLANTPWRIQVVANILPILIRRAKEGRPISYGELAEQLEAEFNHEPKARKTIYGPAVGAVGLAIEGLGRLPEWRGERIPPINTIVVSKSTGYPSTVRTRSPTTSSRTMGWAWQPTVGLTSMPP